jgi:hypothetical protein
MANNIYVSGTKDTKATEQVIPKFLLEEVLETCQHHRTGTLVDFPTASYVPQLI